VCWIVREGCRREECLQGRGTKIVGGRPKQSFSGTSLYGPAIRWRFEASKSSRRGAEPRCRGEGKVSEGGLKRGILRGAAPRRKPRWRRADNLPLKRVQIWAIKREELVWVDYGSTGHISFMEGQRKKSTMLRILRKESAGAFVLGISTGTLAAGGAH